MNPPAEVSTSLKVYQGHTLEKTYVGEDFFWAVTPVAGDYILFKFDKPVNVERLVITCCWSHILSCLCQECFKVEFGAVTITQSEIGCRTFGDQLKW